MLQPGTEGGGGSIVSFSKEREEVDDDCGDECLFVSVCGCYVCLLSYLRCK